jgi:lipopolysaccharide export LptBFGC system permease protein LptF
MTAQDWAGFILTVLSIGGILLSGLKWYIDLRVKPISEAVEDIRKETKTNGGSSMRDEIKFIKQDNQEAKKVREEQKEKLDHMYDILIEYISRNSK